MRLNNLQLRDVEIFYSASENKVDLNIKRDFNPQFDLFPQTSDWNLSSFTYWYATKLTQMWIYKPTTKEYLAFYIPYNLLPIHIRKKINDPEALKILQEIREK